MKLAFWMIGADQEQATADYILSFTSSSTTIVNTITKIIIQSVTTSPTIYFNFTVNVYLYGNENLPYLPTASITLSYLGINIGIYSITGASSSISVYLSTLSSASITATFGDITATSQTIIPQTEMLNLTTNSIVRFT